MLNNLTKIQGNKKKKKIVGRGRGTGKGDHTVGKGSKGQKARAGNNIPSGFEGGQVPLFKKMPHYGGFKALNPKRVHSISILRLNVFKDGSEVAPHDLIKKGVLNKIDRGYKVKIIGNTKFDKKLTLKGFLYSENAKKLLEKSGSTISE